MWALYNCRAFEAVVPGAIWKSIIHSMQGRESQLWQYCIVPGQANIDIYVKLLFINDSMILRLVFHTASLVLITTISV